MDLFEELIQLKLSFSGNWCVCISLLMIKHFWLDDLDNEENLAVPCDSQLGSEERLKSAR